MTLQGKIVVERRALNGGTQRIYPLRNPMAMRDIQITFPSDLDPENFLAEDKTRYAEMRNARGESGVYFPDWGEILLAFDGSDPLVDIRNLQLRAITSYHAQAVTRGCVTDATPATVAGLLRTQDNCFVYGVRGGSDRAGQANIVPGGHVRRPANRTDHALLASFLEELVEETGVEPSQAANVLLMGYQTDPVSRKLCSVLYAETDLTSKELVEMHQAAFSFYSSAKRAGLNEYDARATISRAGLPNVDAWENSELLLLPDDASHLKRIVETGKVPHEGKELQTFDNSIGALVMYLKCYQD